MRRRSGGLHCQTQEEFIELAELSQQRCGLYYDDELNRKKSNLAKQRNKRKEKEKQIQSSKNNVFFDFDYNEEQIQQNQQMAQLKRERHGHIVKNVTIICEEPESYRIELQQILYQKQSLHKASQQKLFNLSNSQNANNKLPQEVIQPDAPRVIDLLIHKRTTHPQTIYKFWFMDPTKIQPELCSTYMNLANYIYKVKRQVETQLSRYNSKGKRHLATEFTQLEEVLRAVFGEE